MTHRSDPREEEEPEDKAAERLRQFEDARRPQTPPEASEEECPDTERGEGSCKREEQQHEKPNS